MHKEPCALLIILHSSHQRILEKAGLPTEYKFEAPIRKKSDRDKLEGKACPDCQAVS